MSNSDAQFVSETFAHFLLDNANNIAYKVLTANGKGWTMNMGSDNPTWTAMN